MSANVRITKREYFEQYGTQVPALGRQVQEKLRRTQVHVCGLGGIGSHVVMCLAELGIGEISANDPQALTPDNLNRFPLGTIHDIGLPKVTLVQRYLEHRPHLRFVGVQERAESVGLTQYFRKSDAIVCCSNTPSSRVACAEAAIGLRKLLLDVSVADGREHLGGAVKIYRPGRGRVQACPACYMPNGVVRRGEGLLATVVATTAALAAHLLMNEVRGSVVTENLTLLNFNPLNIELLSVGRNPDCSICGRSYGGAPWKA